MSEKPASDATSPLWTVRAEDGTTFGPASLASLQAWARDGRLAPSHMISTDGQTWQPVTRLRPLGMDWVAEISPGTFYGPIHAQALEELIRDGSLAPDVPRFTRAASAGAAAADLTAEHAALGRHLETLRTAFTKRTEELERQVQAATAERERLKGELGTKDIEFEAERHAFRAAESRLQADLAKARMTATGLEQQLEQSRQRDHEHTAAATRITELEARLSETDDRLKAAEATHQESQQHDRQALRDAEKTLLAERAAQGQRLQENQQLNDTVKALRLRQESLRKLLQQAGALLGKEEPSPVIVVEDGVVADATPPPRNGLASLNQLEAQAQREISRLGQKANLFGKRK